MRSRTLIASLAATLLLTPGAWAQELIDYTYLDVTYVNTDLDDVVTSTDGRDRIDLNVDRGKGLGVIGSLALTRNIHAFAGYRGSKMDVTATHTAPYPTLDEMRAAFFGTPEAEHWDANCDLNGDGRINAMDLGVLKQAGDNPRTLETLAVNGDMNDFRLGIGYNTMLTPRVGAYAQLLWHTREVDFGNVSFMGEDTDLDANDNGIGATVGARGRFTDKLELMANITYTPVGEVNMLAESSNDVFTDDTLFGIGARYWVTETFSVNALAEGDGDSQTWLIGAHYGLGND